MINKFILPLFGLLFLIPTNTMAGPMGPGGPPPTVLVAKVTSNDVTPAAEYVGHVEAIQVVDLVSQVTGNIFKVHCKEGSFVHENDLLLTIEQDIYLAGVSAAQASVAQAKATTERDQAEILTTQAEVEAAVAKLEADQANLDRAEKFFKRMQSVNKRSITQADLESAESDFLTAKAGVSEAKAVINQRQAQIIQNKARVKMDAANLQQAEAELLNAQINLGYTEIRAPISGRIGRVHATRGNLVNSTTGALARIVQVDPIRILYSVSENELIQIQDAMQVPASNGSPLLAPHLKMPGGTIYGHPGRISFIDNEVDSATGTIAIRAKFPNPTGSLIPGQYVTVQVKKAAPKVMAVVPQAAVLMSREGSSVLMVNDQGIVTPRPITIGQAVGGMWAVVSGLKAGEEIIVSGLQKVRPGMPVTVSHAPNQGSQK